MASSHVHRGRLKGNPTHVNLKLWAKCTESKGCDQQSYRPCIKRASHIHAHGVSTVKIRMILYFTHSSPKATCDPEVIVSHPSISPFLGQPWAMSHKTCLLLSYHLLTYSVLCAGAKQQPQQQPSKKQTSEFTVKPLTRQSQVLAALSSALMSHARLQDTREHVSMRQSLC